MKKRSQLAISSALALCLIGTPVSAYTTAGHSISSISAVAPTIIVAPDVEVPESVLLDLQSEHPDALQITIYEYSDVSEPISPPVVPAYVSRVINIEKTTLQTNVLVQDEFIISVAKGQTVQLDSSITYELKADVSGKAKISELGLTASIKKTFTTSVSWSGPPESSSANSREFRIKFYENRGTYTGVYQFGPTGMGFEEVEGTWSEPSKYLQYSIDHRLS